MHITFSYHPSKNHEKANLGQKSQTAILAIPVVYLHRNPGYVVPPAPPLFLPPSPARLQEPCPQTLSKPQEVEMDGGWTEDGRIIECEPDVEVAISWTSQENRT